MSFRSKYIGSKGLISIEIIKGRPKFCIMFLCNHVVYLNFEHLFIHLNSARNVLLMAIYTRFKISHISLAEHSMRQVGESLR